MRIVPKAGTILSNCDSDDDSEDVTVDTSVGLLGQVIVLIDHNLPYGANRPPMGILPPGDGRFAPGTGAKRPCYNNFKLLNIFLKYAPLSLYSYGISTRLNYVWRCISTLN